MRIGVLGTGTVGQTLGTKLVSLGNEVKLGSRSASNDKVAGWVKTTGRGASHGTFADAASFGEMLFNCTSGMASLDALRQAGAKNLDGKVLVDVANPLDFSKGMPPTLAVCNTDSLGEQIQRAFPEARVVKSLNTMSARVMVDPKKVELTQYSRLPHMIAPVITEPHGAYAALQWLVKEMQVRYEILKQLGLRNISAFNTRKINKELESSLSIPIPEQMPFIVAIVDEFADLMMVSSADIPEHERVR